MAEPKTKPTAASVSAFIDAVPDETRRKDCKTVAKLMSAATGEKPVMWGAGIIGFGTYPQAYADGSARPWPIVGFSPRKNDLTLYLMDGYGEVGDLLKRLGKHRLGRSCLYLKSLAAVDMDVLKELIETSVARMRRKYPK